MTSPIIGGVGVHGENVVLYWVPHTKDFIFPHSPASPKTPKKSAESLREGQTPLDKSPIWICPSKTTTRRGSIHETDVISEGSYHSEENKNILMNGMSIISLWVEVPLLT